MSTTVDTDAVELVGDEVVENLARAALFAAMTGAFAYVSFPNPLVGGGVPVTLQVLGVFLAGILLGPLWGGAAMVFYVVAGALGAPVFAGGSAGVGALLGPTGGYLWSYPVAAAVIGLLVHRGGTLVDPESVGVPWLVTGMVAGTIVIYAFGVAGMMVVQEIGPVTAVLQGAAGFVPMEAFKIAAAIGIVRSETFVAN